MRIVIALVALASSARVCGNEEAPATPPTATVAVTNNLAKNPAPATHGGTVVVVDDVQLELVVKGSGEVVAYPVVFEGSAPVPPAANIEVEVPVTVGPPRTVRLDWNPGATSFEGRVVGATVVPAPTNVEVQIVHQGRVRRARAPRVVIVPSTVVVTSPRPQVVVTGQRPSVDVRVERPGFDVRVERPGVDVRVERPGVDVRVVRPSVDVRVVRPSTRVVVVEDDRGRGRGKHKHRGHGDNGRHRGHGMR